MRNLYRYTGECLWSYTGGYWEQRESGEWEGGLLTSPMFDVFGLEKFHAERRSSNGGGGGKSSPTRPE
jgi:hypothetical protein